MRRLILISLACMLSLNCKAQLRPAPRVTFGAEWGYSGKIYDFHHFNYLSEDEGYRIDEEDAGLNYATNGIMLLHVGVNVAPKLNLALYGGFAGISGSQRVHPISIRLSFLPNGTNKDGAIIFLDGGVGLRQFSFDNTAILAKAGGGYRIALSRTISLDVLLSIQGAEDHPIIWDKYAGLYVKKENIRLDQAGYLSANLTISLNF